MYAQYLSGCAGSATTKADQHSSCTGSHKVKGCGVGGSATDNHWNI
jgi:hypothetical protein